MYLVYLDEVKYQEDTEPYHWLCGLAFPEESIIKTEERLSRLALGYFGSNLLCKNTEFHARDIVHGKGSCKGVELEGRVKLFCDLIDVIDECDSLKRIAVRIDPSRMIAGGHQEKAFMFFVERVEELMLTHRSIAMIISDHDKEMVSINVSSLSEYKEKGTNYRFGIEINHVVDTIHHTHSHHSRLIQLADIYTYTMALYHKNNLTFPRTRILEHARTKQNFGFPSKYKYWPTEDSWYSR